MDQQSPRIYFICDRQKQDRPKLSILSCFFKTSKGTRPVRGQIYLNGAIQKIAASFHSTAPTGFCVGVRFIPNPRPSSCRSCRRLRSFDFKQYQQPTTPISRESASSPNNQSTDQPWPWRFPVNATRKKPSPCLRLSGGHRIDKR